MIQPNHWVKLQLSPANPGQPVSVTLKFFPMLVKTKKSYQEGKTEIFTSKEMRFYQEIISLHHHQHHYILEMKRQWIWISISIYPIYSSDSQKFTLSISSHMCKHYQEEMEPISPPQAHCHCCFSFALRYIEGFG